MQRTRPAVAQHHALNNNSIEMRSTHPRRTFDTAEVKCDLTTPLVQLVFMLIAGVPHDMKDCWWDSDVTIGTRLPRVLLKRYPIGLLL